MPLADNRKKGDDEDDGRLIKSGNKYKNQVMGTVIVLTIVIEAWLLLSFVIWNGHFNAFTNISTNWFVQVETLIPSHQVRWIHLIRITIQWWMGLACWNVSNEYFLLLNLDCCQLPSGVVIKNIESWINVVWMCT